MIWQCLKCGKKTKSKSSRGYKDKEKKKNAFIKICNVQKENTKIYERGKR